MCVFSVQVGWVSQKRSESTSVCHPFEKSVILNQFLRNQSDVENLEKYLFFPFPVKVIVASFLQKVILWTVMGNQIPAQNGKLWMMIPKWQKELMGLKKGSENHIDLVGYNSDLYDCVSFVLTLFFCII